MTTKPRTRNQRYHFKPFEDETHLECICKLALRGRNVGAYLLKRGQQFSFVFGFKAPGIHTMLSREQAEATLSRIEAGLKGFRPDDRLRIHLHSFANDGQRQQELEQLIDATDSLETQFLLLAQQRSTRSLTQNNERQTKQLYLFATYTIEPGKGMSSDRLEKLLAWMIEQYDTLKGMKERKEHEHYQQILEHAFSYGYLHWEHLINSRMGLQASPMTADDLWGYLWQQFNTLQPPPLPQCLVLQDNEGNLSLEEEIQADLHAVSVLIRGEHVK
jgi:hypothetical protein